MNIATKELVAVMALVAQYAETMALRVEVQRSLVLGQETHAIHVAFFAREERVPALYVGRLVWQADSHKERWYLDRATSEQGRTYEDTLLSCLAFLSSVGPSLRELFEGELEDFIDDVEGVVPGSRDAEENAMRGEKKS